MLFRPRNEMPTPRIGEVYEFKFSGSDKNYKCFVDTKGKFQHLEPHKPRVRGIPDLFRIIPKERVYPIELLPKSGSVTLYLESGNTADVESTSEEFTKSAIAFSFRVQAPKLYESTNLTQSIAHLAEEASELATACNKAIRWGLQSYNPELPEDERISNLEWIEAEFKDVKEAHKKLQSFISS